MGLIDRLNKTADRLEAHVESERQRLTEELGRDPQIVSLADVRERAKRRVQKHTPDWAQSALVFKNEVVQESLSEDDVNDLMAAAGEFHREYEKQRPPQITPQTADEFIKWLGRRHPNKLRRVGRDLDWLRGEARKFGIPMEEVRWLL